MKRFDPKRSQKPSQNQNNSIYEESSDIAACIKTVEAKLKKEEEEQAKAKDNIKLLETKLGHAEAELITFPTNLI